MRMSSLTPKDKNVLSGPLGISLASAVSLPLKLSLKKDVHLHGQEVNVIVSIGREV